MSILIILPFIILSILVFVGGYEAIYKGVPGYIIIGVGILELIYFCSVKLRKAEVERSLSIVNEYFDKAYKNRKVALVVDVVSSTANHNYSRTGDSFTGAIGTIGTGVKVYYDIKILNETVDGIRKQLKDANKDFSDKSYKIKDAHSTAFMLTLLLAILTIGGILGIVYGYYTITKSVDFLPIILGIGVLSFCLILIPNIIFQIKYINFLIEAADLLIDAEKISIEDLEKLELEEKENKKN
ncbi:MAG: hypothetical protein IJP63_05930 [Acholeplasmatales bacterium]|nr:hypothetical protein [Acholeplasmatales bacterium]